MTHCNTCKHSDKKGFNTCRCYNPQVVADTSCSNAYMMVFEDDMGDKYRVIGDKSKDCKFYESDAR